MIIILILIISLFANKPSYSDEIILDNNGNYFLMKDDGTFKKLPPPKLGNKYVIKKRVLETKVKKKITKNKKKARTRTNQGIR